MNPVKHISKALDEHNVPHAFFTRHGGCSVAENFRTLNCNLNSIDPPWYVHRNRQIAAEFLGFRKVHGVKQIHSNIVHIAEDAEQYRHGDAIITDSCDKLVGVQTADCAPILLYCPDGGKVAAVHAGWRGASSGVIQAALAAIVDAGCDVGGVIAAIGPCLQIEHYAVGQEFVDAFLAADSNNAHFFEKRGLSGQWHFNLPAYCHNILQSCGVGEIDNLGIDTYSQPEDFYSYRRYVIDCKKEGIEPTSGQLGGQLSVISVPKSII